MYVCMYVCVYVCIMCVSRFDRARRAVAHSFPMRPVSNDNSSSSSLQGFSVKSIAESRDLNTFFSA